MKINGCNALITGASAGIGREFARQLATRVRTLVLVARREQRLNELRDELRNQNAQLNLHVRVVDLSDKSQIDELVRWLQENKIDIDFLINNAGIGDQGPFATIEPGRLNAMIQINITALTLFTRKLLPQMISQKRGAILNVSSSAGFLPIPEFNVYAATKAYVTSFSESLRAEVRGSGVTVTALCPGPVRTEFQRVAQRSDGEPDSARSAARNSRPRDENRNVPRPHHADVDPATRLAVRREARLIAKTKAAVREQPPLLF